MIDARAVQLRLRSKGFVVGVDGVLGPETYAALFAYVAGRSVGDRHRLLAIGAGLYFPRYGINTPLRLAHFLGQTCHETGGYQFLREIWGPTPTQTRYEGRADLGNTRPGDGKRFLGRGLIQMTGRDNYTKASARIDVDLIADPTIAERPDIAVLTACDWWQTHGCNALADADNGIGLGRLINRGSARATRPANGEDERIALTDKAKRILA